MMKGYDRAEAIAFICAKFNKKEHPELADRLEELVGQAIDADMRYMHEAGVLNEQGEAGDAYYEDDDAIEYIVDDLTERNDLSPEEAIKVAAFADEYMDLQELYLESRGLVDWD